MNRTITLRFIYEIIIKVWRDFTTVNKGRDGKMGRGQLIAK